MSKQAILSVRVPNHLLERLDRAAKRRGLTRSGAVQAAIDALVGQDEGERERLRRRLAPAIAAQDAFTEEAGSVADEHRPF